MKVEFIGEQTVAGEVKHKMDSEVNRRKTKLLTD